MKKVGEENNKHKWWMMKLLKHETWHKNMVFGTWTWNSWHQPFCCLKWHTSQFEKVKKVHSPYFERVSPKLQLRIVHKNSASFRHGYNWGWETVMYHKWINRMACQNLLRTKIFLFHQWAIDQEKRRAAHRGKITWSKKQNFRTSQARLVHERKHLSTTRSATVDGCKPRPEQPGLIKLYTHFLWGASCCARGKIHPLSGDKSAQFAVACHLIPLPGEVARWGLMTSIRVGSAELDPWKSGVKFSHFCIFILWFFGGDIDIWVLNQK